MFLYCAYKVEKVIISIEIDVLCQYDLFIGAVTSIRYITFI